MRPLLDRWGHADCGMHRIPMEPMTGEVRRQGTRLLCIRLLPIIISRSCGLSAWDGAPQPWHYRHVGLEKPWGGGF